MIRKSLYKNIESIVLENDILHAEIVPGYGARTSSLIYKPKNQELLWQNSVPEHAKLDYAMAFGDGEAAGFDEMLPSINECEYPDYPWKGTIVPDHGEVWSLPWNYNIEGESVVLEVNGVRFPYIFSKTLSLDSGVFRAVYRLHNRSLFRMLFLYAAHPLFNVDPGDRIIVPPSLDKIVNAVPSDMLPDYGREYGWDDRFALMPQSSSSGYKKYYFKQKNTEGWSALRRERAGLEIRVSVPPEKLPCLGIWMNEGGWNGQFNIALEPASASMDDLNAARRFGCESFIEPGGIIEWNLEIGVSVI